MNVGFHLSVNRGYNGALATAQQLGLSALQVFAKSPRSWRCKELGSTEILQFHAAKKKTKIKVSAIHASYLVNLAADAELAEKSIQSLLDDLAKAYSLGMDYVIVHAGSGKLQQARHNLLRVLEQSSYPAKILIENSAGGGHKLGAEFEELAEIIRNTSAGVCIDTCHAFVAGYPLHQDPSAVIDQLDKVLGLQQVHIIHFNDARGEHASHLDQHANLLEGKIGPALQTLLATLASKK